MKKMIAFFVALVLCASVCSEANAVSIITENQKSDTVYVYTEEELLQIIQAGSEIQSNQVYTLNQTDIQSIEVVYSYEFLPDQLETDKAYAVVDCVFYVGTQMFYSVLSGTVSAYELSSGDVFWTGPITGIIDIADAEYDLIAAFSKLDSDPAIQMEVTMQAQNEQCAADFALFSFGSDVITMEICEELFSNDELDAAEMECGETMPIDNVQATATSASYQFVGSSSGTISMGDSSFTGQTVRGYFDATQNIFVVSQRTYCSSVENWARDASLIEPVTNVSSCDVTLTSNSHGTGSSSSWIDGVCNFGFSSSNFNAGTVVIKALFSDLLSILGVPTSTISLILDGVEGKVEKDVYANTATMGLTFGMLETADFDASSVGLPFAFQLDKVESSYTGNSSYTFSSSITYCTKWWPSGANHVKWFYTTANDASRTVTITLG